MASFNQVTLVGNITRDIEVRFTPGGTAVADVSLAINNTWKDKNSGEKKEDVTFVDCTLWGKTAELAGQYLGKGRPVLFSGRLVQDTWDDKETGKKRSKLKVVVETMQFLGSGPGRDGDLKTEKSQGATDYAQYDAAPGGDETPF